MPYAHAGESIDADVVISDIKGMKSADVEPVRHGRWVDKQGGFWEVATCSNCGEKHPTVCIIPNYCPNCGAIMDLSDECKQEVER